MGITKSQIYKRKKIMEKTYNKLVRDKIPQIITENNEIPIIKILNDNEYKTSLENKLLEEYNEVINADDNYIEELADMLEVIDALAKTQNKTFIDVLKIKEEKKNKRGGFENKIFLEKTTDKELTE